MFQLDLYYIILKVGEYILKSSHLKPLKCN